MTIQSNCEFDRRLARPFCSELLAHNPNDDSATVPLVRIRTQHAQRAGDTGEEMGPYFETYLDGEARAIGYSLTALKEIE